MYGNVLSSLNKILYFGLFSLIKLFSKSSASCSEGLVNYALSISNVNMAVLIIETKERIKFSFRSIGQFSVNEFAKKYFNGGGHKNAAGGSLEDKLSVALEKFLKDISKYSKDLNY